MITVYSAILLQHCGKQPTSLPAELTGNLQITGFHMDGSLFDSIGINLDDFDHGTMENPATLTDLVIGSHRLFVYSEASSGTTKTVEIREDALTTIDYWLAATGPYVGNVAPSFTATDVGGNQVTSESLRGKVVLLAFFEHT